MWKSLLISDDILKAIEDLKFEEPTPIQQQVLTLAIRDYADILGSAPTGSGKTLAFGVPLLMRVREAKVKLETSVKSKGPEPCFSEKTVPPPSQPSKKSKKLQNMLDAQLTPAERKRKMIFSQLGMIEELDPDTLKVKKVHDASAGKIPEKNAVVTQKLPNESQTSAVGEMPHGILGLVILPTRELALQVADHLRQLAKYMQPAIVIQALVGGIAIQKQARLLKRQPDVVVATPGRLWEFLQQEHPYVMTLEAARVVVFDEADRLVESNHFADLRPILNFLRFGRPHKAGAIGQEQPQQQQSNHRKRGKAGGVETPASKDVARAAVRRQTFVFSATLTFVHKNAMMPGMRAGANKAGGKQGGQKMDVSSKLGFLRNMLGLSAKTKVADLSTEQPTLPESSAASSLDADKVGTKVSTAPSAAPTPAARAVVSGRLGPSGLSEFRLTCRTQADKDILLLWFLLRGRRQLTCGGGANSDGGRCLVFLNSKSAVRRLAGVLRQCVHTGALGSAVNVLHADMVQKQRLRSVERFQACPSGIVLATDVAARGLDFTGTKDAGGVSWVVHFDVPRTAEVYIHRCGRTARAQRRGVSILLMEPSENVRWYKVAQSLNSSASVPADLPDLEPGPSSEELSDCSQIARLMRDLDQAEHTASKKTAEREWFKRSAAEADIILDSDLESAPDSDSSVHAPSQKRRKKDKSLHNMRQHLDSLIAGFQEKTKKATLSHNLQVGKKWCSFSTST
nr:unnamed protein product [Spirometra erinaceieuropaei]